MLSLFLRPVFNGNLAQNIYRACYQLCILVSCLHAYEGRTLPQSLAHGHFVNGAIVQVAKELLPALSNSIQPSDFSDNRKPDTIFQKVFGLSFVQIKGHEKRVEISSIRSRRGNKFILNNFEHLPIFM